MPSGLLHYNTLDWFISNCRESSTDLGVYGLPMFLLRDASLKWVKLNRLPIICNSFQENISKSKEMAPILYE